MSSIGSGSMTDKEHTKLAAKHAKELVALLAEARNHLEYTGYGDSWERSCAVETKLPERLNEMLERFDV
jgi:hypothetical protein